MLEGLAINETSINLINQTENLRLESEFYTSLSFNLENHFLGKDIIDFVQYGTSKELNEESKGYPVLRLNEFDSSFISIPSKFCEKIDSETFSSLKLLQNDVLICRTNGNSKYVGKSALVPEDTQYAYASYLFKIRPITGLINSSTLVAFLNSKFGRIEIEKYSMASNQVNFSPAKFKQIRIPKFTNSLNNRVEKLTFRAFESLKKSKQTYTQAEQLLLSEIGLQNFTPSTEAVNIKSFADSFATSGRLDAEYYQPKYEDYLSLISNYNNGSGKLSAVCDLKDKNYKPIESEVYQYIELSNIGKSGDINGCTNDIGGNLPSRARRKVNVGDVIISSIEGSLDSCALVTQKYDHALCSTGFYVVNSNDINSETLLVLFKSEILQNILKQNCSGTILTAINKDEFLNIPLPIIDEEVQSKIADLVEQSFTLKQQSEHLLEVAKRAVEIAIEESEDVAMAYIEQNIG